MSFHLHAPSTGWEPVSLATDASRVVWGWFKPPQAPNSVALQVPPEVWQPVSPVPPITVRQLQAATGVPALLGWTIAGQFIPLDERTAPFIDVPLAAPPDGVDPLIILWCNLAALAPISAAMPVAAVIPAMAVVSDLLPGEDPGPMFDAIASHWAAIQRMEGDIRRIRSQLAHSIHKLFSLNRDLGPEEKIVADNIDKKEFNDARRWMRDALAALSRSIKQIDIGMMSGAGKQNRFEDIFQRYVQPRIPFAGLKQAVTEFEMHHRTAKNVIQTAQSALSKGTADAERRATTVLQRIAAKVRQQRNKARGKII
ncbi:MAG: hypothetical protein AABP62_12900 [Planctomycetota bacterium]